MNGNDKNFWRFFIAGMLAGLIAVGTAGVMAYQIRKASRQPPGRYEVGRQQTEHQQRKKGKGLFLSFESAKDAKFFQASAGAAAEIAESHPTHGSKTLMVKI